MLDFGINIGLLGVIVLAVGALTIAVATQLIGEVKFGYEWAIVGLAALAGGFVASEWIVGWRAVFRTQLHDGPDAASLPDRLGAIARGRDPARQLGPRHG